MEQTEKLTTKLEKLEEQLVSILRKKSSLEKQERDLVLKIDNIKILIRNTERKRERKDSTQSSEKSE